MNEEAAFLKAIADSPDDPTPRLVFADWLQDRDDPRAGWVRDDDLWKVMAPDARDPRDALVLATKRGDSAARRLLVRIGGHAVPAIFAGFKRAGSNQARILGYVLDEIGAGAEVALPFLIAVLDDPETDNYWPAQRCLGKLAATNDRARARLIAELAVTDKQRVWDAAWALTEVGPAGADAVPHLLRLIEEPKCVSPVARSLASVGPGAADAIPVLVSWLAQHRPGADGWFDVRNTLRALGPAAVAPLLDTAPGRDATRYAELVDALTHLGPAAADELRKGADHPHATARNAAAEALARLAPASVNELLRGSDPDVVTRTLAHLRVHDKEAAPAVPALTELLADRGQPSDVRHGAAFLLGRVGTAAEPAVPVLIDVLRNEPFDLAELAQCALDATNRHAAASLLLLIRKPATRREAEIEASRMRRGRYGGDRPVASRQELHRLAARLNRAPAVVATAAAAFGPDPLPALTAALGNEDADVRLVAVMGLWHVATPEAAAALVPALGGTEVVVAEQAAEALGHIGRGVAGVTEALTAATAQGAWAVRLQAQSALVRLR